MVRALEDASDPQKATWRSWIKTVRNGEHTAEDVQHLETSKEVLATHRALLFVLDAAIRRNDWPTNDRCGTRLFPQKSKADGMMSCSTISDAPSLSTYLPIVATASPARDHFPATSGQGDGSGKREAREANRRVLKRSRDVEEGELERGEEPAASSKPPAKRLRKAKAPPPALTTSPRRLRSRLSEKYNLRQKPRHKRS